MAVPGELRIILSINFMADQPGNADLKVIDAFTSEGRVIVMEGRCESRH